jgi:hypothetical protein
VTSINARIPREPFSIDLHSITDPRSFWDYIKQHEGRVTSVTLDVAVPNMFDGVSSFEDNVKRLREHNKARRVKETRAQTHKVVGVRALS